MNAPDDMRPDGRAFTSETRRLRIATRALRLHLDELPIDYRLDVSADHFLTGLAFMSSRQRYDCAESMIGAGFGGTVLGSLARSVFVDGLRWLWIGQEPGRHRRLLGDLLEERNRLCKLIDQADICCPNLSRWLMPLPDVADLTGQSLTWLDARPMPGEEDLLDDFLAGAAALSPSPPAPNREQSVLLRRVGPLLDMAGLRGAVMILAHAGHGNYLGLLNSLTEDGAIGHDLRADHEALFMQVAAAGVTATLLGTAAALPDFWPDDVDRDSFLNRAVDLAADVAAAAAPIHRLGAARPAPTRPSKPRSERKPSILHARAILRAEDLLDDLNSTTAVAAAAEEFYELARNMSVNPWASDQTGLHNILTYGAAHSNLQTVMSTYDKPGSEVIAVFAARMLLEEAARLRWRFSVSGDEFKTRAKQFFDEYRAARKKTVDLMIGSGVPRSDAVRIFAEPGNVVHVTPVDQIAKGRVPLPTVSSMLREMGAHHAEPGWLEAAYSLLSQMTHSTPIGLLHTVRFQDGGFAGNEMSPEMLGLALDAACYGSAHLIGVSTMILTDLSAEARGYHEKLLRQAAVVHDAARLVHGLD